MSEQLIVDKVRNRFPGFVGNAFAKKASDEDIIKMVTLKNEHACAYNMFLLPINNEIKKLNRKYRIKL